ncbi:hypothetical protein ACDP63_12285 [Paracoccus sp. P2]|uniref:Glycosyl transferase family 2 n=1 Tax=Paracoccus pantotrophus TaxID=82367 RepID=A0A1I5GZL8_PARPN|nr:hypothetical protein [Paracoccus pantotrophus]MDF3854478.1 hypothetical protein [Paracoccus pantotrophus]QFG38371.1 hypothetical protein ESD82_20320 [Paracoccus pantotrophus]QLH15924.1 hypothetical protein HYQ43_17490 [Paracoccus pantotrophus]RDD98856.1 hypothetical protein DTW92_04695 [Paracoccus pantotrophus]RKS51109.1 hypothetical protein BDE18_0338 [Paracoccus pantotrophus]
MLMSDKAPYIPSIALLTFVLEEHHCVILEDWIAFFDHPIAELVVHFGGDPGIAARVRQLCEAHGIRLHDMGMTTPQETTEAEQQLLAEQFDAVTADLGCVVRLDTIPYRAGQKAWQDAALGLMKETGACFITGSTLPYRADRPTTRPGFMLTQSISNCFLIIRPEIWKMLQAGTKESESKYGRFLVEGAAEDYVAENDLWGLRLVNRDDIRVFHCQEWGLRLLRVRDSFRKGHGISSFLKGYQDDYLYENARYYMQRRESALRRARIFLGYWRRRLFSGS